MTESQLFDKLVALHTEIADLNADVKDLLSDGKEKGFDAALINKIAKAKADLKLGDLQDKTKAVLGAIEKFGG